MNLHRLVAPPSYRLRPSHRGLINGLFGSSATMKGCRSPFQFMLTDGAPWYLPVLFGSCLLWILNMSLREGQQHRPFLMKTLRYAPVGLMCGLLLYRVKGLADLDPTHNEIVMVLGGQATLGERFQLLMTGQGAIEGAFLALLLFSLWCAQLPSLNNASSATKEFVRERMMVHTGLWSLLILTLLFPEVAYSSLASLPQSPTIALSTWSVFGAIALFTLLLMMSGELIVASAHSSRSEECNLLAKRATMKMILALPLGWFLVVQNGVFEPQWWSRPGHDPWLLFGFIVLVYATMVTFYHGPATMLEGHLSQQPRQSITLGATLAVTAIICFLSAYTMASKVELFGQGSGSFFIAWRVVSLMFLAVCLGLLLPAIGYDSAHRPEQWWLRLSLFLVMILGAFYDVMFWLLLPGLAISGSLYLLLPWCLEEMNSALRKRAISLFIGQLILSLGILVWFNSALLTTLLLLGLLPLSGLLSHYVLLPMERRNAIETA